MTLALLALLAVVDSAFCGYRAAAGRSALIRKREHYARALRRGAAWGLGAVALAGAAAGAALASDATPGVLADQLLRAAARMLWIYVPYAAVLGLAFAFRALPSVDVRSLTSTLVFGPLTLLRPIVLVTGVVWGVLAAPQPVVLALGALVLTMMLALEPALGRHYRPGSSAGASPDRSQPT